MHKIKQSGFCHSAICIIGFISPVHTGGDNSIPFRYIPSAINAVEVDPFTTSRHLKMCIITQFLLYHNTCRISISEQVLRKILSRCNQRIYKVLQALVLLYMKLPCHTFHRDYSAHKKPFFFPKPHSKIKTVSAPEKSFQLTRKLP